MTQARDEAWHEAAEALRDATWATTPRWTFRGQASWVRVIDVYDGDTVTVALRVAGGTSKLAARLLGIDAMELRAVSAKAVKRATKARNRLAQLCGLDLTLDGEHSQAHIRSLLDTTVCLVWMTCVGEDKYGRLLVDLSSGPGHCTFSRTLIDEKHAAPYPPT